MSGWRERFAAFVERKEREARDASLSALRTEVDRAGLDLIPIGSAWTRQLFGGPFYLSPAPSDELPAVSLVFVQSRDGNTGAENPATLGGGETDHHLIYEGLSRAAADAVLAGAQTIRGGDLVFSVWHPELVALRAAIGKPRHPVQVVATLRGFALDDLLIFNVPELRVVVLTLETVADQLRAGLAARPWIVPVVMQHPGDLPCALRAFRRLGIDRMSAVGGRTVTASLLDAGLVQDLYLTTSPTPGGEPNTPLYPRPLETELVARKRGTGADSGVVFEHRIRQVT